MRVSSASSPLGTAGKERAGLLGCPHPAFGHPLPKGEGYDSHPSYPLSLWERVGVRVFGASSPLGTAGKERAGLLGCPHPAFGHPLPEGEGLIPYPSGWRGRGLLRHLWFLLASERPVWAPVAPSFGAAASPPLPAGESLIQLFQYGLAVLQDFVVPEAEDGDTFARQENCPRSVLSAGFGVVVLSAVNFDSQPCFVTIEVQYIWGNRMLPAKLGPLESSVA